jgi:2-polyprenyl-3-methyl-5-hydroxy-6-metoxy-1,4-benzoquinol methylase/glycosyltransferase involved in cell wall biosynthesis
MTSPITLALIVKNEPFLEKCLLSIKDYVAEIVIVDTGSTDGTLEIVKKYADIWEVFTDCNDPKTGLIEDFSMARERSFALATQPWVMWCDGDDTIEGGEHLEKLIKEFEHNKSLVEQDLHIQKKLDGIAYLFPYEYAYNEHGQCTLKHYRERLFSNKNYFKWVNPVHEVVMPIEEYAISLIAKDEIVFKHHRQFSNKPIEPGRNLRILKKYYEKVGDSDARQLYYLGLECSNHGLIDEAIGHLIKYINVSGWEDERVMACLKLIDIYYNLGKYEEALPWAFKAIEIKEDWSEGYLALAKMFYFIALKGGPNEVRNWQKCVFFTRAGLKLPPTKTLLFVNPLDRDFYAHVYLNMALNKLGDVAGALESVNEGLKSQNDPMLLSNKKIYENFIARSKVVENIESLKNNDIIDQKIYQKIIGLIHGTYTDTEVVNKIIHINDSDIILQNNFPLALNSDNGKYWKIPSSINLKDFPIKMTDDQLQSVVILIWKQYMLHDEVLSAINFLENAPINVRHSETTEKALSLTKDCIKWLANNDLFIEANTPIDKNKESGAPLPFELYGAEGNRFWLISEKLKSNHTILDLGSFDGCFTNRFGLLGHKVYGIDACESSVILANKKAQEFNTGATHIHSYFKDVQLKVPSNYFDYVTSSDTYEHIQDPVNDMFKTAYPLLKEDGKFLLVTPHGSWTRGEYIEYAEPWVHTKKGKSWLDPYHRAHIVAPTVWTVADNFRKADYWVKNCFVVELDQNIADADIPHQGNIFAEACKQKPRCEKMLDVIFYIGDGVEEWTPDSVAQTGIGGSELMAIEMSKRLAALGHKVRVYNSCGLYGEGIYDGVTYYQTHKYHDLECDVLVVSRRADKLENNTVNSKLKLLWVHDMFAINANSANLLQADRILALSQWHKEFLVNHHDVHPDQVIVTRNGIDLERFDQDVTRNSFKCVNSSSPDRSWPVLLKVWPEIKARVPEAELHLYYGFKNWEYSAQFDPAQKDLINSLKNQISSMSNLGVVFHDRIDQKSLAKELLSSGVWLYSTWFSETSCITAMEMQAAGVEMVTSSIAALNETAGDRAILIDGDWATTEYQQKFIDAAVEKLTSSNDLHRKELQNYAKNNFDLNLLAKDWQEMFFSLIEELKTNPIVPYQPTKKYLSNNKAEELDEPEVIKSEPLVKLNIGAGPNIFPFDGWVNYDREYSQIYFNQLHGIAQELRTLPHDKLSPNTVSWTNSMTDHQRALINYLVNGGKIDYKITDVQNPFPQHNDNSVDIIYLGQMIEHLNPIYTIPNLLNECYRMLKPGGILRITTPDLDLLIDAYKNNDLDKFAKEQPEFYKNADPASQLSFLIYGACGPDCKWNNYEGHMFLFNKKSMRTFLTKSGFEKIEFFNKDMLTNNEIIKIEINDEGLSHSLIVEAVK